ncbi:MAG: S8 family serine peptidase, partial [Phycisphaerae bacterium]|nr:S8 family serine peptidase [Phycisphaerae bacterium]
DRLASDFPTLSGAGQTVAVIDTGIDYTHPRLGGGFGPEFKVIGGYDFVDRDNDPRDTHGHGTAIAGIIAGDEFTRNGLRFRGVAPDARLVALRIARDTRTTPNARIAEALDWVIANRAAFNITTVNISFGSGHFEREPDNAPFATQLADLAQAGVVVVAASGNRAASAEAGIEYPAADSHALSVGSVNEFDVISEFTQRGRLLDLLAPGEDLIAPWLNATTRSLRGTSYAAPFVAGAAVLLRQADPTIAPAEIASVLRASGRDNLDGDDEFGSTTGLRFPRLNLPAAVGLALARAPAEPEAAPDFANARANSLAVDSRGVLHVAWNDPLLRTLFYATRSISGTWSRPWRVEPQEIDAGQFLSLALDSAGRPGIAYFDGTHGDLRYARFDPDSLAVGAAPFAIDVVDSRQSVGLYPSTRFSAANRPVVAYYHRSKGDLRLAEFDGGQWQIRDVDRHPNDRGRSASMAINSLGRLAVAYEDSTSGKLKFARQTGAGWMIDTIDDFTSGVSFISLAFDPRDRLAVSYYDAARADLKFAMEQSELGRFHTVTVASRGAVGLFSQLTLNDDGVASILYHSRRDEGLFLARGTTGRFIATRLHTGGRFASAAVNPVDQSVVYAWLDSAEKTLRFNWFQPE